MAKDLIAEYQAAFRLANPGEPVPEIHHRGNGWYGMRHQHVTSKHRKRQIMDMTERLLARAKQSTAA